MKISELIDKELKKQDDERKTRVRSGKFSPSSFGRCLRQQVFNRRNVPKSNPPDDRTLRVFKAGQLFHDYVQQFIPKENTEVLIDVEDVLGYADIVTKDTVYDIKSQHSRAFWYLQKEETNIVEKKKPNWLQVAWYAMELNKEFCSLVFVSKDDLCMMEYIKPAQVFRAELHKELKDLRNYWSSGQLPPPVPRAYVDGKGKSQDCKYCNWKDRCKEVENEASGDTSGSSV